MTMSGPRVIGGLGTLAMVLWQGAAGYARAYAEAGLHPGEVVVLILQHGPELALALDDAVGRIRAG